MFSSIIYYVVFYVLYYVHGTCMLVTVCVHACVCKCVCAFGKASACCEWCFSIQFVRQQWLYYSYSFRMFRLHKCFMCSWFWWSDDSSTDDCPVSSTGVLSQPSSRPPGLPQVHLAIVRRQNGRHDVTVLSQKHIASRLDPPHAGNV